MVHRPLAAAVLFGLLACGKPKPEPPPEPVAVSTAAHDAAEEPPPSPAPPPVAAPLDLDDEAELREGLMSFVGMARPTKGGIDVRGVVFSVEALEKALKASGITTTGYDELLGAKLRVVADLEARDTYEPKPGEPMIQTRSGGFISKELVEADLVNPPEMIEGQITRSKGLFQVGKHLVNRDALSRSLSGEEAEGKRVRLWGQSRTYVCAPQEQCLTTGRLPMFDVARAELR